jgi:hypothetical protein
LACAWRAGPSQLGCRAGLAGSDHEFPLFTARSGTQRARAYLGEHLIRRSGHTVQDRLVWSVYWADIPQLSRCVGCCPPAWLQSWLQSRGNGADPRPFAFQTGHIPSSRGSSGSYALSSVAAVSRWLLPLLSPSLSAAVRYGPYSRWTTSRAVARGGWRRCQTSIAPWISRSMRTAGW